MITGEYLRNLKTQYEQQCKDDHIGMQVEKYKEAILYCARKGGKKYEIIDINETIIDIVYEKLKEIFDTTIIKHEYANPIMPRIQHSILITW